MKRIAFFVMFALLCSFVAVSASDLSDIQQRGVLKMGTAPDYVPFVFYDENGTLTGIDVELVKEAGRRMGLNVEVIDMAFDGLMDAVNVGQVDIVGGGISITGDRSLYIDFSQPYYASASEIIAKKESYLNPVNDLNGLRGLTLGVQKGSSFDNWAVEKLVNSGIITLANVMHYTKIAEAVTALDRGNVDVVVLDSDVYDDNYKATGKYKTIYTNPDKEQFGFVVRKGSDLLQVFNKQLSDMLNDGTAQKIATKFFSYDYSFMNSALPRIQKQQQSPILPPSGCSNAMAYVSDVTIFDNFRVAPNDRFTKTWRVVNNGTCTWDSNYIMTFVAGDRMGGQAVPIGQSVPPGGQVEVSVNMVAPSMGGKYKGYWQMQTSNGATFGQTLWTEIGVDSGANDGQNNPVSPYIQSFYVSPQSGSDCTTAYWAVDNASMVQLSVDGQEIWRGETTQGNYQICRELASAGTHEIQLMAFNVYDSKYAYASYQSYGSYQPEEEGQSNPVFPSFRDFSISPESGPSGTCTTVFWSVTDTSMVEIFVDGNSVFRGDQSNGSYQICDELRNPGMHMIDMTAFNVYDNAYASDSFQTY